MQIYTVACSQEIQKGDDAIMLLTVGTGCVVAMGGGGANASGVFPLSCAKSGSSENKSFLKLR